MKYRTFADLLVDAVLMVLFGCGAFIAGFFCGMMMR